MPNYLVQFNGYTFPLTLMPNGGDVQHDLAEQELPRADGSAVQKSRRKSRPLTIQGAVKADTSDALTAIMDALRAACLPSQPPAQLFFGRDDRYYMAQVESFGDSYSSGVTFGLLAMVSIGFRAAQPDAYDVTPQTAALPAAPVGYALTPLGDAPALPTWTITIGGAGSGPLTLTNAATGETCTLTPIGGSFNAGDVITLTRDGYTVALNGAAAFGLLGGRMPKLLPGANGLTLSAGGSATVLAFSATYTPRWY